MGISAEIVERLRAEVAKTSRAQIAKQTGYEKSTISRLVSGDRPPTAEQINRLAAFWGLRLTASRRPKRKPV